MNRLRDYSKHFEWLVLYMIMSIYMLLFHVPLFTCLIAFFVFNLKEFVIKLYSFTAEFKVCSYITQ